MKYRVTIEGRAREVEVLMADDGTLRARLDGAELDVVVDPVPGGVCLHVAGRVFDVAVGGGAEALTVSAGARRASARVVDPRAWSRAEASGANGALAAELRAPMPGRVVRVLVAAGDEVQPGAPLVVVEAMKMENELRAGRPAKIARVDVAEGQSVESGAVLVRFA